MNNIIASRNQLSAIFKSREFRIFFLLCVIFNELLFHFDLTNFSVKTYSNIYYDFSGSWRHHVYRFLSGETLYQDFYYPYPPIGFYIISALFYVSGSDVFHQSIATALVATLIHLGIFLLVERKVQDDTTKTLSFLTALLFLNASPHEIFLGGNPFPLILGFLFFIYALLFSEKARLCTFLILLAASCKHEFWIGAALLGGFHAYRDYKKVLPLVVAFVLISFSLGYDSLEVITGMGRSSWARWNFHWEAVVPQVFLLLPVLFAKRATFSFWATCTIVILLLHYFQIEMARNASLILLPLLYFFFGKPRSIYILYILAILMTLQIRRGFEWGECTYNSLLPIFFAICSQKPDLDPKRKFTLVLPLLFLLSIYQYSLRNSIHFPSNDKDFNLHHTEAGNLESKNKANKFKEINAIIKNKSVFTFPFCPGLAWLSGAKYTSPVSYYYNRETIKTFDYYNKEIGNPAFIVIDSDYLTWDDYPTFSNPLLKWKLELNPIDLREHYPELFERIDRSYRKFKTIDNFVVYERVN